MPISKRAGERIRIIDQCLKDQTIKYWSFEKLSKYILNELTLDSVSERTIRGDIRDMKLNYGAPIKKEQNRGWYYTDESFSIFKENFSADDIELLHSAAAILNQFEGLRNFEEIAMLADKVEETILRKEEEYISLDVNNKVKGLKYSDRILRAIKNKTAFKIKYQPFNQNDFEVLNICAYQLKEYNNRWFVLAKTLEKPEMEVGVYALDRILGIEASTAKYITVKKEIVRNYFKDIIGVTNYQDKKVERVTIEVFGNRSKYVSTKKWHPSMKIIRKTSESTVFDLLVKLNPELESMILSYGSDIMVKAPKELKDRIIEKLKVGISRY
jgi:predicted DNA-binding transcriptional regulator YafY